MRTCEKCGSEVLLDGKAPTKAIPDEKYDYYRRVQMAEGQLYETKKALAFIFKNHNWRSDTTEYGIKVQRLAAKLAEEIP